MCTPINSLFSTNHNFFQSSNISLKDKIPKPYEILFYNTMTEPMGGAKYYDSPLGLNIDLNTTADTKLHKNTWSHFTFVDYGYIILALFHRVVAPYSPIICVLIECMLCSLCNKCILNILLVALSLLKMRLEA